MGQLNAVDEETKLWGILQEFLIAATALDRAFSSGQSLLLHSVYCSIEAEHQVLSENKPSLPSLLFSATHILKINNDLLSGVLTAWTLSSLFAFLL